MIEPKGRNDSHKFDFSKITDKIYLGSDLCKGGVCLIHQEEFKKLGIGVEVNLSAEENELPPKNIEAYLWLPVVDGHAPSRGQLEIGTCFMDSAIKANKVVYVHCRNGHGRSPTLVSAYLIRYHNLDVAAAIDFVKGKRPEVHIEDSQLEALIEFSQK